MATVQRYPQGGKPETVHFDIIGKQPSTEEAGRLTGMPVEKKPVTGHEAKEALKWFAVGVGAGVALWFFGRWVIGGFRGIGVLFFGYGAAYVGAPISVIFGISNLFKLFRSAQKKKPEAALRWVYEVSYLGEDAVGTRFGKLDYAVATLERIVPSGLGFDKEAARSYIQNFRDLLTQGMEQTTAKARKEPPGGWAEAGAQKHLKIEGTKELAPGVVEMEATLSYQDMLSRSQGNNNTVNMIAAVLELHIRGVFIRSGKYWFPYDVSPEITCRQDLPEVLAPGPAAQEAAQSLPGEDGKTESV